MKETDCVDNFGWEFTWLAGGRTWMVGGVAMMAKTKVFSGRGYIYMPGIGKDNVRGGGSLYSKYK